MRFDGKPKHSTQRGEYAGKKPDEERKHSGKIKFNPSTNIAGNILQSVVQQHHQQHTQANQMAHSVISYHLVPTIMSVSQTTALLEGYQPHHFFSPPSAFCTLPPIAPSGLKFLPIAPSLESGPPTFSPMLPMAPSLVKAPPMAPFASKAAGAFWSVGFWPLWERVSMYD